MELLELMLSAMYPPLVSGFTLRATCSDTSSREGRFLTREFVQTFHYYVVLGKVLVSYELPLAYFWM